MQTVICVEDRCSEVGIAVPDYDNISLWGFVSFVGLFPRFGLYLSLPPFPT